MIMERTRYKPKLIDFKRADAILCSDMHLREDTPTCFVGDFQKEQWDSLMTIKALQEIHSCLVIHAGDLFHHWKASPWLLSMTIKYIPDNFYTVLGQHDLPQHSLELIKKCGVYTLSKANKVNILPWCHWGQTPEVCKNYKGSVDIGEPTVLVWHHLTYQSKPYPGAEGGMAAGLLRKYPQFDLIVTGDNHQSFTEEYQGRRLVNPGNLTRQAADQIDYKPRVALWYAEDNSIEWIYLPIQENAISREHLIGKEERDTRIDAFVSGLNTDYKIEMSFEQNLEAFFNINRIRDSVKQIIYKSIEK